MKPAASRFMQGLAIVVFTIMVLLAPATARAQESRGAITGKVLDAGNAVIQGATVKVTNVAMGTTLTLRTNEDGFYQAPYLIPGTYQMTAEANGFKRYVREGIVVQVNDSIRIDIELEVGTVDQTVTVTADAPLLNTTSGFDGNGRRFQARGRVAYSARRTVQTDRSGWRRLLHARSEAGSPV